LPRLTFRLFIFHGQVPSLAPVRKIEATPLRAAGFEDEDDDEHENDNEAPCER